MRDLDRAGVALESAEESLKVAGICRGEYAHSRADHVLFPTDSPYDGVGGDVFIRETINSVEELEISNEDRKKIFEDNARRLFRLPV
jgi:predicted TIM-barrel fold metal-dependent hydrolase